MVVDRGHAENAFAGPLEPENLNDNARGFQHEQAANDQQDNLVMAGNSNCAKRSAEGKAARVAHKHRSGGRIEP